MEEIIELFKNETDKQKKIALWNRYRVEIFEYAIQQIDKAYEDEKKIETKGVVH